MSETLFGVIYIRPSKRTAKAWDRICKKAGSTGYTEVNRTPETTPEINNRRYQGWFTGPDQGEPSTTQLAERMFSQIAKENFWESPT